MPSFRCESPPRRGRRRQTHLHVTCNLQSLSAALCSILMLIGSRLQAPSCTSTSWFLHSNLSANVLPVALKTVIRMNRIIPQIWDVYLGEGIYSMTIYLYHATAHYPTFQALAERLALGLAVMHLTRLTREGDFDRSPLLRKTSWVLCGVLASSRLDEKMV